MQTQQGAECGGVLIPDGTRHCYVVERGITGPPKRLQIELDHIIPISLGGSPDGPTHPVHAYCQRVQGGYCQPLEAKGSTATGWHHTESTKTLLRQRALANGNLVGNQIRRGSHHTEKAKALISAAQRGIQWTAARRAAQERRTQS